MLKLLKFTKTLLILLSLTNSILAQEVEKKERLKFIGIEAGIDFLDSDIPNYDFIRGDITYYGSGSVSNSLQGFFQKWYLGLKTEVRSKNEKFGLSSGIRYTKINSSLGKSSYSTNSSNYFYLLYNQTGLTTEFIRINEINQVSEYIGIPLELRLLPFNQRLFNLYFKIGAEFNYLLKTDFDVIFHEQSLESYQNDVLNKFDDPDNYYFAMYAAIGWLININNNLQINIEANVPSIFVTDYSTGIINPVAGGGFQINIQKSF